MGSFYLDYHPLQALGIKKNESANRTWLGSLTCDFMLQLASLINVLVIGSKHGFRDRPSAPKVRCGEALFALSSFHVVRWFERGSYKLNPLTNGCLQ